MSIGVIFDIGGTWLKGTTLNLKTGTIGTMQRVKSPVPCPSTENISKTIIDFCYKITAHKKPDIIAISTAGVVDYFGHSITKCADHLKPLDNNKWINDIKNNLEVPVILINDCEAAMIGAALKGYLKGDKNIALCAIGTGLGFSVWRNGRRWRPGRNYTLMGSVATDKSFDNITSVSLLADSDNNKLCSILTNSCHKTKLKEYLDNLVKVFESAAIIYSLDEILFSGGLINASLECNYPLLDEINKRLTIPIKITLLKEGNELQLLGIANLAIKELLAQKVRFKGDYNSIATEKKFAKQLDLQKKSAKEVVDILWQAEQTAGKNLKKSLDVIAKTAELIAEKLQKGGRIIYVGCGTSGRIAAIDDVELSCTFGLPEDKSITLIAGGIADASLKIETEFEEDASSIPETLLLNITKNDILIGISASSTAYYVRSALMHAKSVQALTVLISNVVPERNDFFDIHIPLQSGPEVISGSTRLKAGTATKKIINMLSSTTMILLGKVENCYMIDVACLNEKLKFRAEKILNNLYQWSPDKCRSELKSVDYKLIDVVNKQRNINSKNASNS